MKTKITIIVYIINDGNGWEKNLYSLLNQSMPELEIIYVNNIAIQQAENGYLEEAKKDGRVKFLDIDVEGEYDFYAGFFRGIKEAQGEYILFMLSCDELNRKSCEILYSNAMKYSADILLFNSNFCKPKEAKYPIGKIENEGVFAQFFKKKKWNYDLHDKLFDVKLCKSVVRRVRNHCISGGYEFYWMFCLSKFAKRCIRWIDNPLYKKRYVDGEYEILSKFGQLEYLCTWLKMFPALSEESRNWGDECEITRIVDSTRENMLSRIVAFYAEEFAREEYPKAAQIIEKYLSPEEIAGELCKLHWSNMNDFSPQLLPFVKKSEKKVSTIAFYYHRMRQGGIEHVMSILMPMFMSLGYKVVLITQEEAAEDDYPIPVEVKRIKIIDFRGRKAWQIYTRLNEWRRIVEENKIDLVMYETSVEHILPWDLLYLKELGIKCIIQTHCVCSYPEITGYWDWPQILNASKLADIMVNLSAVDSCFWQAYHDNVWTVPDPMDEELKEVVCQPVRNHVCIFVGRLCEQKRPDIAIEIIHEVAKKIPDVKLLILGEEDAGSGYDQKCRELIQKYGMEDMVEMCGFHKDIDKYYKQASVHILTASHEGFSLALLEAKGNGLPTVMNDMPYLITARPGTGIIGIDRMDINQSAQAVIRLFEDENYWQRLSREARKDYEWFREYDYAGMWKQILEGKPGQKDFSMEDVKILSRTLVNHHLFRIDKINKIRADESMKPAQHEAVITSLRSECEKQRKSISLLEQKLTHGKDRKIYWGVDFSAFKFMSNSDLVVDDNSSNWGRIIDGHPICSPEVLDEIDSEYCIVVKADNKHSLEYIRKMPGFTQDRLIIVGN